MANPKRRRLLNATITEDIVDFPSLHPNPDTVESQAASCQPTTTTSTKPKTGVSRKHGGIICYDNEEIQVNGSPSTLSTPLETRTSVSEAEPDPKPETGPQTKKEPSPKRKQGASVMMDEFGTVFPDLQQAILSLQWDPALGTGLCRCGKAGAIYRCTGIDKCFFSGLQCQSCIVNDHVHLPFHRIQRWNKTHFEECSLGSLGLTLRLGHYGKRCPSSAVEGGASRILTILHFNGYHSLRVYFCHCLHADNEYLQLTKASLFPATIIQPESAFTFGLLDEYSQHVLSSKKPSYDYHDALVKLTNPIAPHTVPKRYNEFNRVFRVWQHLSNLRRAGQAHGIDTYIPGRKPGCLAVRCPACPEVGVNLDRETLQNATEDEAHKHTCYLSGDGNHRLQRKNKQDDPDDYALKAGKAYFVNDSDFTKYLGDVVKPPAGKGSRSDKPEADPNPCAHLRAARMQNMIKFKNAVITGVVAIQCARHGIFMPRGMADLQKGEAYANSDYVLAQVLYENRDLRWVMLSYDIWCSFKVNICARFEKNFPDLLDTITVMKGAIPSMHVTNHVEKCQYLYSFRYTKHSGTTYGEQIESSWAEGNQAGGSTREMNGGHRHDALDEFHGYWNWTKVHRLASLLLKQYTKCLDELKTKIEAFDTFSASLAPSLVAKWKLVNDTPYLDGKKNLVSVHAPRATPGGPPTKAKAYETLLDKEKVDRLAGKSSSPYALFLHQALAIEDAQYTVKKLLSIHTRSGMQDDLLAKTRHTLGKDIVQWRKVQISLFPDLVREPTFDPAVDLAAPENSKLYLPSVFAQEYRLRYGMEDLARAEWSLRQGEAYDALETLRLVIRTWNFNFNWKKKNVRGQSANTRAQQYLQTLVDDRKAAADRYSRARTAMIRLAQSKSFTMDQKLKELLPQDLWGKDNSKPGKTGEQRRQEPWFWNMTGSTEDSGSWMVEYDRVKWYRDRSARDRYTEEKEILEEEMSRTVKHFHFMRVTWQKIGASCQTGSHQGSAAYAFKQSAMFGVLEQDARKKQGAASDKQREFEAWYREHNDTETETVVV